MEQLLNEDTLDAGVEVEWEGQLYLTGNRYKDFVELWRDKQFVRTVKMSEIKISDINWDDLKDFPMDPPLPLNTFEESYPNKPPQ
jgi:hypothetical protein